MPANGCASTSGRICCSAADDVDAAGDKVRDLCDRAVDRVDSVVATVNDRLAPTDPQQLRLHLVAGREAS